MIFIFAPVEQKLKLQIQASIIATTSNPEMMWQPKFPSLKFWKLQNWFDPRRHAGGYFGRRDREPFIRFGTNFTQGNRKIDFKLIIFNFLIVNSTCLELFNYFLKKDEWALDRIQACALSDLWFEGCILPTRHTRFILLNKLLRCDVKN